MKADLPLTEGEIDEVTRLLIFQRKGNLVPIGQYRKCFTMYRKSVVKQIEIMYCIGRVIDGRKEKKVG